MEIQGEVQNIRKDKKALQIENIWYQSSFKPISESIKKGDKIKLVYSIKGDFKNIKSIKIIETKELENKKTELNLSSTDRNCIIMTAKDLALGKHISLEEAVKITLKAYKLIF